MLKKIKMQNPIAKQELMRQFHSPQRSYNPALIRKSSVWSREKINQLIELYKKHECLWNYCHEWYKSKDKRNRAIEEICTTLQVPRCEFGKKIHNLRNQFNTEMKKLEQRTEEVGVSLEDAAAMELRCKWSHFESLMFLRNVIEPRPGGYQNGFQQKIRENDLNVTPVYPGCSGYSSNSNQEDLKQYRYNDNVTEEVIAHDYQSFDNEVAESVEQASCSQEVYDRKYQPQSQQQLNNKSDSSSVFLRSYTRSQNKESQSTLNSTSSQTTILNVDDDASIPDLSSNNLNIVSSQPYASISTPTSSTVALTAPVISSISLSNRPATVSRDQWDAFGELVANEIRNLNSEISRKRLKRRIMQAMLEVGEDDDNLIAQ